jgi:hypothetical protein
VNVATFASMLLRLYPRGWRRRYEPEMRELLAHESTSLRTVADLVAGAIDARLNPQAAARGRVNKGETMTRVFSCNPAGVSRQDQWRSAAWMIGGSIVLTVVAMLLERQFGENPLSEGLVYAAFPASLMLSSECTYFKRYSPAARAIMSIGGAALIVLVMWGSVLLAYRI